VTALQLFNITKRFGDLVANDDVSFTLAKGEVLALLGENGAGKSTLMNILFGHYVADSGSIKVFGETLRPGDPRAAIAYGVGMVHQHFTLADNLSVLDNVMLGTEPLLKLRSSREAAITQLQSLSQRFGLQIDPNALVRSLSVGEKQRVEILKALYRGAKILILDEPTSVLTPQEVARLFVTLKQLIADGLSIIFISHKLDEVLAISNRIAVLRGGKLVFEGNTADATKASLAKAMVGRDIDAPRRESIDVSANVSTNNIVLQLDSVCVVSNDSRVALQNVSLSMRAGEIVAIAGVSGNGQTLLTDVICGVSKYTGGKIELKGEALPFSAREVIARGVARIPEDRQHVGSVADLSVWENAILPRTNDPRFSRLSVLKPRAARAHTRALVREFDVRLASVDHPIRKLSGGNIQKLILGRELCESPALIVAAQPTWGLDVGAVAFIHSQLRGAAARGTAVLLISEDLDEVFALADRITVMSKGRLSQSRGVNDWTMESIGLAMAGEQSIAAGEASAVPLESHAT
jgi:general nucleoside transport system ATP-binding protein